jgi:hypothetical protein
MKYIGTRKPTLAEKKKQAEIVFMYEDEKGKDVLIFGCKLYESWEQWGASEDLLYKNVKRIEAWRNK